MLFEGYVDSSTRNEIRYAIETGKRVRWLEQPPVPPLKLEDAP